MLAKQEKILLGLVIVLALAVAESKPTFRPDIEFLTVVEGLLDFRLVCKAQGDTPISYVWYNENEDAISEDSRLPVYVYTNESASASFLIISSVQKTDEGVYTCTATNDRGSSSKIYQLAVLPSEDKGNDTTDDKITLRGVTSANITSTSVTFGLDIAGPAKKIAVKYRESREEITRDASWSYGDVYEVKGLVPGGLYNFSFNVGAVGSSGHEQWSPRYQVTLLPDTPEVIFRNLEGGQIEIGWFRKFDDIMRGTVDRYELSYYTVSLQSGNTWIPNDCAITVQIPSCSNNFYTVSGLSQNVYYEIQLRAHAASGFGEPYRQKIYMTR